MTEQTLDQALVNATLDAMQHALDDPSVSVPDHALEKAGSLDDQEDGSVIVDLDMAPGRGPTPPAQHGTWTGEDGRIGLTETFELTTATTVRMNLTNLAQATITVRNRERKWTTAHLTPEQQETLDRYATQAAFWLTGVANGALTYCDEDPDDHQDQEDRRWIIMDQDQEEIRRELGRQALACLGLARRANTEGDLPDAAYVDAAAAIRRAAGKVARANQYPGIGEARTYHRDRLTAEGEPHNGDRTDRFYLELDAATTPERLRQALLDAGVTAPVCEPASPEHLGYILTEDAARTAWEDGSGYSKCQGECARESFQHQAWEELADDQKDAFLESYTQYLEMVRTEDLMFSDLLYERRELEGVLTSEH